MTKDQKNGENVQGTNASQEIKMPKGVVKTQLMKVSDLIRHHKHKEIYTKLIEEKIDDIAKNILERGLILNPTVNTKKEILSGVYRIEGLKRAGISEIQVQVIDISEDDELDFIIAENHFKEKTINDERNEIIALRVKYLKRKGENNDGEHTNKLISQITGSSTDRIAKIVKIHEEFDSLFDEIANKKMSLNAAWEKAKTVQESKELNVLMNRSFENPKNSAEIGQLYIDTVKDFAEFKGRTEYNDMIDKDKLDPKLVAKALKKGDTLKIPKESEEGTDVIPLNKCSFCGGEIADKKVQKKLSMFSDKIIKLRNEIDDAA